MAYTKIGWQGKPSTATPITPDRLNHMDEGIYQAHAQLAQKVNKDEVTNGLTPKGSIAYASLPITGNNVGDYYYCPDGDGTNPAGNYAWNGTSWYFAGTGDEGYSILRDDLTNLTNVGEINIYDIGEVRNEQYINYTTGQVIYSANYETIVFANNGYDKIIVQVGHSNDIPAAIAFYSVGTYEPSSFLSSSVKAKAGYHTYVAKVPTECKVIAIVNRKADYTAHGSVLFAVKPVIDKQEEMSVTLESTTKTANILDILSECFIADIYSDKDLVKDGLLYNNDLVRNTGVNKHTLHISLEGVRYIKYEGIYGNWPFEGKLLVGMSFYDKFHNYLYSPEFSAEKQSGIIDLKDYPDAVFVRFCNYNNNTPFKAVLYSESRKALAERKKIYVGAYYFAGWSEWELPNIHFTKALLQDFAHRKPVWGWFAHGSYRCDAWLYSPEIQLSSGENTLTLTGSCVFNSDQCSINVYSDGEWHTLDCEFYDPTDPEITSINIDLSDYANKNIKLGFRIFNRNTDIAPIWTINALSVVSNGVEIFSRNFINNGLKDFTTNDEETWKHGQPTLAYSDVNGYVGTPYDTKDTSIIEKEIMLAKNKGIDYFLMDWYYHDGYGSFNQEATENEPNHIGLNAFIQAAHKYDFKYCIMIANHEPFVIDGIENWKAAINYINETYVKDPAYLKYNGIPVISVFEATKFNEVKEELEEYIVSLGYPNGWIWQVNRENARYAFGLDSHAPDVPDQEVSYEEKIVTATKLWADRTFREYKYKYDNIFLCLTTGYDVRPWKYRPGSYARHIDYCVPDVDTWREFVAWAFKWVKAYQVGFKSLLVYAWNEFGEGGYLVPTEGDREASFLCALSDCIRDNELNL